MSLKDCIPTILPAIKDLGASAKHLYDEIERLNLNQEQAAAPVAAPVQEVVQQAAQVEAAPVEPAAQIAPVAIPEFKKQPSTIKFKSFDSTVEFNYARIMKEIDRVINLPRSSPEMKEKYKRVKQLLENSTSVEEVRRILQENKVAFGSNSITSGGTRKRRMQMRKRAKTLRIKRH
jgi:hypothetical protein